MSIRKSRVNGAFAIIETSAPLLVHGIYKQADIAFLITEALAAEQNSPYIYSNDCMTLEHQRADQV
jgi:hypothetical protein